MKWLFTYLVIIWLELTCKPIFILIWPVIKLALAVIHLDCTPIKAQQEWTDANRHDAHATALGVITQIIQQHTFTNGFNLALFSALKCLH